MPPVKLVSYYRDIRRAALPVVAGYTFAAAIPIAVAQSLPAPSRTVYKCEADGKVTYSDSPCLGAAKIDVEPTRGVSKLSGSQRVGADVRKEQHRETIANALKPLTGMNPKQYEVAARRRALTPDAQRECQRIDSQMPVAEKDEGLSSGPKLVEIQRDLYRMRIRFRELGC